MFLITYVCLLAFPKYRAYIALLTGVLFIVLGILPFGKVLGKINFNVLMMIAGTMGIVALFIESKMPALLADIIISKVPNMKWATILLAIFAGVISAFVDNVATVLMIAPVALDIAKKLKVSPVASLICISITSNLEGAATLVGDTTSILLGGEIGMNFIDFFWMVGRPGLFFINQIGLFASVLVLLFIFRKDKMPIDFKERTEVKDYFPTILLLGMIVLLIIASLITIPAGFVSDNINGLIVMVLLIVGLVYRFVKTKDLKGTANIIKEIDYFTLLLLLGLFMVIGGLVEAGVIDEISKFIENVSQGNLFLAYTIIVWISVLFSAFVDNIPYVLTMLPVVGVLGASFGFTESPAYVLYFGLLVGATLGGNLTPIGASANITTIGILRKEGHEVKATTFMKYSVPFTLAAVTVGYILTWLLFNGVGR
jgi:Na+/H+ antiporter NhaD/arsenite permease-like protein